jgi:hypothetical protein
MTNKLSVLNESQIKDKIHTIRSLQVMLDSDLASLYQVETKALNQAVKRNISRFPKEFMFQLTDSEHQSLRSQNVTLKSNENLKSQSVTSRWGGRRKLPYAFTEQGVAMLSGILKSDTAVRISIQIMNAFVSMRKFIASNAQIFQRLDTVEKKQLVYEIKTDKQFEQIFTAIESKEIKPEKGIFFDGQIFDSYKFISDIIRSAKESITLIDNYVDDSVLTLFNKRKKDVDVKIFTKEISKQLSLDLKKYNSQYELIKIIEFKNSHDRFIIIDNNEVYHFGASLKDLGKKWFAFSKFDKEAFKLLDKLDEISQKEIKKLK